MIPVEFERVELREGRGVIWPAWTAQHDGPPFRLPVWVGEHEAALVQIAAEGLRSPRPLTIDVLRQVLLAFDLRLEGAAITAARDGLLHAELTVGSGTRRRTIDCRPSDALALALRERAPIAVAPDVARAQGVPPA
ncbi:bifunctional nuclease family protein [Amnibacterium kyonggiense]